MRLTRVAGHSKDDMPRTSMESVLSKPFTKVEEYYDFWVRLENSSSATSFFTMLMSKLIAAEKGSRQGAAGDIAVGAHVARRAAPHRTTFR